MKINKKIVLICTVYRVKVGVALVRTNFNRTTPKLLDVY